MKKIDWMESWGRIKKRFPNWQPTDVEAEDWCIALRVYDKDQVEDVSRQVRQQYASQVPAIKWFIVELEKRRKTQAHDMFIDQSQEDVEREKQEIEAEKELHTQQLEVLPVEKLREGVRYAIYKYPNFLEMPKNGNVREWSPWLRAVVWTHLLG